MLSLVVFFANACSSDIPDYTPPPPLEPSQSRTIELRYTTFDVTGFEQTFTKEDLANLPREVQNRLWLLNLDLTGGKAAPKLLNNALEQIRSMDPNDLSLPARNMRALLLMTPATANLQGTSFSELLDLAPVLGVSTQQALAGMLNIHVGETFLSTDVVANTILRDVISTHPNAFQREGPVTANHPDGEYPVPPGKLPVTLADAASDFGTLSTRFGETYKDGVYHPGFIVGDVKGQVFEDDFKMTVRTNANALPYKGVDLTNVSRASVNSITSQIQHIFDFSDPNWLRIQGVKQGKLAIDEMTFQITESPEFIHGGKSPDPAPYGNSPVWKIPHWTLEYILADASLHSFKNLNTHLEYDLPNSGEPAMDMSVTDGWAAVHTAGNLGAPPVPQYIWDLLLEVGQTRLHDGGIPEGDANVQFTLHDIPIGYTSEQIQTTLRQNLEANPTALLDIAKGLLDNTHGAADFYYYRPDSQNNEHTQGDYLYFVLPEDIGQDDQGNPTRPYHYAHPGFFSDNALTDRISTAEEIDGDSAHQKLKISAGMTFYAEDDDAHTYKIKVLPKQSENIVRLKITRMP